MNILVDNKKISFSKDDFPFLVHGAEKTGSSFFSICLLANLLKAGMKTFFFSAYPMAKEEFRKQIIGYEKDTIIVDSGDEKTLIETLKNTPDLNERVVLIKNIDSYSSNLFNVTKNLNLIILSGDLDKCQFADSLIDKKFATKILFSPSEKYSQYDLSDLPKYNGKIINNTYNGMVSLDSAE
jgi:hypothetical protein